MPRGAEYDNGAPQSDNPIEVGENKAHGASGQTTDLNRAHKAAEFPEGAKGTGTTPLSGQGSAGHESGKGGHETKTLGENKGHGAQGV